MYNNIAELAQAMLGRMSEVQDPTLLNTDPELTRLTALAKVYDEAIQEAKQYGWVGVGCITFAENRLRSYQQLPLIHDADFRGFDEYGNYGEQNHPLERD